MIVMQLYKPEEYNLLAVTEKEAARLVEAARAGETLFYEGEGGCLTLEKGTLTVEGYEILPILFSIYNAKNKTMDLWAKGVQPLKNLVKKAILSDSVKRMGMCFCGFSNLTEVSLPDTVECMYNTFKGCNKLKPYALPKGLREVSGEIFGIAPEELILPEGITDIASAFSETKIRRVTLPSSLKALGTKAFSFCRELESVTFSEGLTEIGYSAFSICDKLTALTLPKSLTYIGDYAFSSCTALEDVVIPEGCRISSSAFNRTPLQGRFQSSRILNAEPFAYTEDMGKIKNLALLQSTLAGKSLKEQCGHFRVLLSTSVVAFSYGEEDGEKAHERGKPLLECEEVESLILRDGIVVGVICDGHTVLAGESVCTYYAVDEDGTGVRERSDYCTLFFTV